MRHHSDNLTARLSNPVTLANIKDDLQLQDNEVAMTLCLPTGKQHIHVCALLRLFASGDEKLAFQYAATHGIPPETCNVYTARNGQVCVCLQHRHSGR